MGGSVRRAGSDEDRAAAFEVRVAVFVEEQGVPYEIEGDDLDATAEHVLAEADGRVVGAGRLAGTDDVGVLGRLAVLAEHRGSGLGADLVRLIEQCARERGCARIELHAQTAVRTFYERLGYTSYGEEFLEAGILHVSMSKRLGADTPG